MNPVMKVWIAKSDSSMKSVRAMAAIISLRLRRIPSRRKRSGSITVISSMATIMLKMRIPANVQSMIMFSRTALLFVNSPELSSLKSAFILAK